MFENQQKQWLAKGESLKSELIHKQLKPVSYGAIVADESAFQGWRYQAQQVPEHIFGVWQMDHSGAFVFDFGRHCVGYLTIRWSFDRHWDAPFRVRFLFGELPAELGQEFSLAGGLSRAWLQDETVILDVPCGELRLPRRYAFRYLKVIVERNSGSFHYRIDDLTVDAVSAVDVEKIEPVGEGMDREIDRVGLATLADCMQDVFEDGPKRDRRCWSGDLRLEALVNYKTFRNYRLVKRCLYLFAGFAGKDGCVMSDLYWNPVPAQGNAFVLDYTALFPLIVLEYAEASEDWECVRELWPVICRQSEYCCEFFNADGLYCGDSPHWRFIDWCDELDRTVAEQGAVIRGLRALATLAERIDHKDEAEHYRNLAERFAVAARSAWLKDGLFRSGEAGQLSWASQAYMVLADVFDASEGASALKRIMAEDAVVCPRSPYLMSYMVEALLHCGCREEALAVIRSYWGKMIQLGADTFWEVFDVADPFCSPYNNTQLNSACHAWSCTPSAFYRM